MCVYQFMIFTVSRDHVYKLWCLRSYVIRIWIASREIYYSHVHVIVFTNIG